MFVAVQNLKRTQENINVSFFFNRHFFIFDSLNLFVLLWSNIYCYKKFCIILPIFISNIIKIKIDDLNRLSCSLYVLVCIISVSKNDEFFGVVLKIYYCNKTTKWYNFVQDRFFDSNDWHPPLKYYFRECFILIWHGHFLY